MKSFNPQQIQIVQIRQRLFRMEIYYSSRQSTILNYFNDFSLWSVNLLFLIKAVVLSRKKKVLIERNKVRLWWTFVNRREYFAKDYVITSFIFLLVCGVRGRAQRIVGGSVTLAHEYPWLVGLSKQGKMYCGGSLITKKHILTAAHCINGMEPADIRVTQNAQYRWNILICNLTISGLCRRSQHNQRLFGDPKSSEILWTRAFWHHFFRQRYCYYRVRPDCKIWFNGTASLFTWWINRRIVWIDGNYSWMGTIRRE